ncbi:MAG: hypothetical protein KJ674_03100 [Nanoarchaeota archaeon]|nr:hypothetical protein [Nanoarchaeota archaeon]
MNKKGDIFLPIFAILMFVVVVIGFSMIVSNENKIKREFNIGENQIELIDVFYQSEVDLFNLDQKVRYTLSKSIKEFSEGGGVGESCNNVWEFNSDCEPDLENDFLEIFKEKYGLEVNNLKVEGEFLTGDVGEFVYSKESERMSFDYTVEGKFKELLIINFEELEDLKDKIENCVQNEEELDLCAEGVKEGDIVSFKVDLGKIFTEAGFEEIVFEFKVDVENTGIITSVI